MTYNSERRIDKYTFISLMLVYFYDVFSSAALLLRQGVSGLYEWNNKDCIYKQQSGT